MAWTTAWLGVLTIKPTMRKHSLVITRYYQNVVLGVTGNERKHWTTRLMFLELHPGEPLAIVSEIVPLRIKY